MFPVTDVLLDFTMTRANLVLTLARQEAVAVNIKTDTLRLLTSLSPHVPLLARGIFRTPCESRVLVNGLCNVCNTSGLGLKNY